MKRNSKTLDFAGYKTPEGMSRPQRAAHALDWAAANCPRQFVAYNLLLKAIMGYPQMPRLSSDEVAGLRGAMTAVRKILREKYARGCVSSPGIGVRATVDSEDQLKTDVVKASHRVASANRGLINAASLVDPARLPQSAANRPWLAWWKGGLREQLAQISQPDFARRMLAPSSEPDKGEVAPVAATGTKGTGG